MAQRLLSGVKPTGTVHIGNYFGAMRQFVDLQNRYDCFLFIADLHALNQIHDPKVLAENVLEVAKAYLAIGLDPAKVALFSQAAVSEHAELCCIFNSFTSFGLLERAHAYKDALAKGKGVNVGLFDYPVLMAADILLYKPEVVPVGRDQQQHLEIMEDIAGRFNHLFGQYFTPPKGVIMDDVAVVLGTDGRKMSKSYNNVLGLFDTREVMKKKVMGIVTDSRGPAEPKDPDSCTLFSLHRLVNSTEDLTLLDQQYRAGTISYKDSKELLVERLITFLAPFQQAKQELDAKPEYVEQILEEGAERARAIAQVTLREVKERVGLLRSR